MNLSAAPPPPAPVHPSSFHFAKSSTGPVTAQWTAREPKQKHERTSSGGGGIKQLFGRKPARSSSRSPSPSPAAEMYAQMFPQTHPSQPQPSPQHQHQPQQHPFPGSAHTSSHGHGARGAVDPEEDDYERQLDYETDANTSYNAAQLAANLRQPAAPAPNQRGRTKSKSSKGKERERASDESKARRKAAKDQARRTRRRAGQLDSDTTQGEDTDSDEYVTGYGNTKPVAGMFGSAGAVGGAGGGAGGGGGPRGHTKSNSTSMPTLPPTSAHPYVANTYTSPTNQYAGYAYAQAQPNPYAQAQGQPPYGVPPPQPGSANPYAPYTPSSYFSPTAPQSAQFPNLFAQTNPGKPHPMNHASESTARHFAEAATKYGADAATAYATEAAVRNRLKNNPLPGLPGSGAGGGGAGGAAGMPGLSGGPGGMPGLGGGMPAMGGMNGMPGGGGMHGAGGMSGFAGGAGGMPGPGPGMPVGGGGTLPGGYGGQPTREKSKSKGHVKSASTGTLPAQHARGYPPSHYPPARTTKMSDPLPPVPSKGRASREQGRGRSGERDRERSRSRSRPRPGWDTAESLLGERDARGGGISNGGHGTRILNDGRDGGTTMFNGVPVVNAGPQLERVPSRSKWGKITGLFTRGRRGSAASQQEAGYGVPPPVVVRDLRDPGPPPVAKTHKSGLRNLSFDRLRRGPSASAAPPPPPTGQLPPRGTGPDIGMPPGTVPVGIHVDRYGKIVEPPEGYAPRARVPGFRPGRGGADENVEGPIRLDASGRRTSSDAGYGSGMGMGMGGMGTMRRTSSDAPMPGYGMGVPPPLGGRRPSMDRQGSSQEGRRPSFDGPDAYGPAPRHRAGSSGSQPPPPLMGTIGTNGAPGHGDGYGGPGAGGGLGAAKSPAIGMGMPPLGAMKSPAGLRRHGSWEARSPASGLVSPHTPRGMPSPHIPKGMPSPHIPHATPRYGPSVADSIMSPRMEEGLATPYTQTARYEAAGATPYMRERDNVLGTPRAPSIATTVPRTLPRPRTADSTLGMDRSPTETPSPDVAEADMARAAQHREAFEWAELDAKDRVAQGDDNAPYIFNGFPTWLNWDLFTRLENAERRDTGEKPLPRVSSDTQPEMLKIIYGEWHATRDKWVDRFWDPRWAVFMREVGGPIQQQLAEERQTDEGRALEAARVYQRENSELPLAKREFAHGYLWDGGYMHPDWWWIPEKAWHWAVEHENDERRAKGRAPLPRYHAGMSADAWRDVRDVWHTTASKWAEKRKDIEWLARDKREGMTPERRNQLEQQFLRSRQLHKVIRKASGQRSREALRPEERDKIRHDSAMELLARKQEAYKQAQASGTPRMSEAERRRQAARELEELMRTPATTHPRPASSIGHASTRRGEGSIHHGGSSVGHAGPSHNAWGNRLPDEDTDPYDSTSTEDVPPIGINPYARAPNGLPPPPPPEPPLPEWMRREKTSDPPSSSMQSIPGRNPSAPSVSKAKKPGILKGILKRTLSIQRNNNNNNQSTLGRTNSRRNGQAAQNTFAGMFNHGQPRNEVSPVDNPWAGVFRSTHPVSVQPIRFDRNHPFSMTSPHALNYEGKLYPSAIHLWHALRFLRRPVGRGRGRTEESFHPELAEAIRNANEPELHADQWAHAGAIGKDGTIMRSLQRPDWEEVQMEKMDEVLALKFTQHPRLGEMLVSTHPAELLYMWDGPWGAGTDLKGPNNLGKAVMRCRDRLLQYRGR